MTEAVVFCERCGKGINLLGGDNVYTCNSCKKKICNECSIRCVVCGKYVCRDYSYPHYLLYLHLPPLYLLERATDEVREDFDESVPEDVWNKRVRQLAEAIYKLFQRPHQVSQKGLGYLPIHFSYSPELAPGVYQPVDTLREKGGPIPAHSICWDCIEERQGCIISLSKSKEKGWFKPYYTAAVIPMEELKKGIPHATTNLKQRKLEF